MKDMDNNTSANNIPFIENEKIDRSHEESAVNFQRFIYDIFEKKGVLNELRANLRGHIVEVLKSAQTGEPPTCQKHFTQRLDLLYQAVNILIAEYFLRLEFGYSLSVFVSEIPLSNMAFDFAKNLMENKDIDNLKFKECDVWSVLNYLGVKCDSYHATNILNMYNRENVPLLLCILTSIYQQESVPLGRDKASSDSLSSSVKSLSSLDRDVTIKKPSKIASAYDQCHHYAFCKTCQAKLNRVKERYKRSKKSHLIKRVKSWNTNPPSLNVKMLMKDVGDVEENLVDEMFQQLKSVYEAEVEMIKRNDEKVIKRSLASHALQLQKRTEELEETFKAREAELERNVQEKKEFLWGLARALRQQHAQMSRAMDAVKCETERLTAKEESLKSQLQEAEDVLKKRGEDMRKQISEELIILESHLESMKKERENINQERKELDNIKSMYETNSQIIKVHDLSNDELRSHYDLLKDELGILRKYLETTKLEPKCVIERSTLTEMSNITSKINLVLNNEQELDRNTLKSDSEDRIRSTNKVVNDLKKQKNVNFSISKVDELYHEPGRGRSRSSGSSEAGDTTAREIIDRLREENERLKTFADQQREHIDELSSHGARLRAELAAARAQNDRPVPRPRTAPSAYTTSVAPCTSAYAVGWRKGAGEEMSIFSNAQPRILLPGDQLPLVGVLRERATDSRRHLLNQWRSIRERRTENEKANIPLPSRKESSPLKTARPVKAMDVSAAKVTPMEYNGYLQTNDGYCIPPYRPVARERSSPKEGTSPPREKTPKSVLKEVKEKLSKYNYTRDKASTSRDQSPTSVLREARTRLRKLEIEAEAVENSYLEFRRRQDMMKMGREVNNKDNERLDFKSRYSTTKTETKLDTVPHTSLFKTPNITAEFDRYQTIVNALNNYKNRNMGLSHTRPIPEKYSKLENELKESQKRHNYYLETPLEEFRKLYRSQTSPDRSEKSISDKLIAVSNRNENKVINEEQNFVNEKNDLHEDQTSPVKDQDANQNSENINKLSNQDILNTPVINEEKIYELIEEQEKSPTHQNTKKDELDILKENINNIYNFNPNDNETEITPIEQTTELETTITEKLKIASPDGRELVLVVEETVDTKEINIPETDMDQEKVSTQMTIIVSPIIDVLSDKAESINDKNERSVSPEQAANLTRNDALNAIFQADPDKIFSSEETELDVSKKEDSISEEVDGGIDDYPDDFSADVDNYNNSRSDYEANSPISLPKNSEDDNDFWDT